MTKARPDGSVLAGYVAVVTGASGGLGTVIARTFASSGASLVLLDITVDNAEQLAEGFRSDGMAASALRCDVTAAASVAEAAESARDLYGRCDILINNAGVLPKRLLEEESTETWDHTLAVNLRGPFLCTQQFGALMRANGGGSIVNIASIGATAPTVGAGAYSASKAGLLALTRQTAVEWGPYGIRANAVSPGYMHTPMTQNRYAVPGLAEQRASKIPLGRIADLTEVANAVAFLAGPLSSYVNGQELLVDGGFSHTATRQMAQPAATIGT